MAAHKTTPKVGVRCAVALRLLIQSAFVIGVIGQFAGLILVTAPLGPTALDELAGRLGMGRAPVLLAHALVAIEAIVAVRA